VDGVSIPEWVACPDRAGGIAFGLLLPVYPKLVARLAEQGVELSWLGHLGVFAFLLLIAFVAVVLVGVCFCAVGWVIERFSRRPDDSA
jgi:hypothetical protein